MAAANASDDNALMIILLKVIASAFIFVLLTASNVLAANNTPAIIQGEQNIRVGVYDNYPKIYRDEDGNIKGFWADITNAIARKENWNVTYVYGTFDQGLDRLKNGQTDLMVDVGVSPQRQQIYDFNNEHIISSWATIYSRYGLRINSFLDLSGKKIAVLKSDIHYTGPNGITATLNSFGVNANFIETDSYDDIFKQLDDSQADAGVVNGLYGEANENKYRVTQTGILFDPTQLKYAMPKNAAKNPYLISTIDSNLIEMKQNPGSVYYQSLDAIFGRNSQTVNKIPTWFYIAILTAGGLLIASVLVVLGMRQYQRTLRREIQNRIGQIKDNEEKYSAVVNQAQDGIGIIQNEKIIFANRAINILGYPEKEVIGMNIADLIAPEENSKVVGLHRNRVAGNATASMYETILTRKDGTKVAVEISSGIINYSGEPAVLVLVRDITQRKQLQEDVKLQNSILAAELDVSINGVLIVDKLGNVILYNQRFVDIWHAPKDALETGSDRILLNSVIHLAKDPQAFLEKVDYLYKHKNAKDRGEIELTDGRILDRYTAPLYVDNKVYVGRVWFFQDITEQKLHAEKIAQVERAKQEFVSIAAHQLRAPVTAIMNAAGVINLNAGNLTDTQHKFMGVVLHGVKQMNELVDFLLTMTKAETGSMTFDPTPIKLKRLTHELVHELDGSYKKKAITIKITQTPNKMQPVNLDKNALSQVIINILSNAVDYSPEGSQILVSIVLRDKYVEFTVKDEGIGIPEADRDKIFDKFYRADNAKEAANSGTGLGLALAKSIVESWGGKIWVESEENKGSTFFFTIPIATQD
jgi:PAS domain S-box-containing protein